MSREQLNIHKYCHLKHIRTEVGTPSLNARSVAVVINITISSFSSSWPGSKTLHSLCLTQRSSGGWHGFGYFWQQKGSGVGDGLCGVQWTKGVGILILLTPEVDDLRLLEAPITPVACEVLTPAIFSIEVLVCTASPWTVDAFLPFFPALQLYQWGWTLIPMLFSLL